MYPVVRSLIPSCVAICLAGCAPDASGGPSLAKASRSDALPAATAFSDQSRPVNLLGAIVNSDDDSLTSADQISGESGNAKFHVSHSRFSITLTSSDNKVRPLDVEVWYPAEDDDWVAGTASIYRSRLWGVPLFTATMDPLRFQTVSAVAREGLPLKTGHSYPLVLHSHGNNGQPFDVAEMLEIIAGHGYVVAAAWHTNDNHDDLRVDVVNRAAKKIILPCLSGGPSPCLDPNSGRNVADRVLDLKAIQENIGSLFGDQVDTLKLAIFGYSRGGATAMAAAGGSVKFGITAMDSRLKGIFAWAGGQPPVMDPIDTNRIERPAVFMTSSGDKLVPAANMKAAYDKMPTHQKAIFQLNNATHNSAGSNKCAQMQAAGAIRTGNPRAFLEESRLSTMLSGLIAGTAYTFCEYPHFTTPVDIRAIVTTIGGITPTPTNVPSQLSVSDVQRATMEVLLPFLHVVLNPSGKINFSDGGFLNPRFALKHEPAFLSAEATYLPSEQDKDIKYNADRLGTDDDDLEPLPE